MKKTLLSLAAVGLLFVACNKDDNDTPQQSNWHVSRIAMEHDTLGFSYNADGTVDKIYEYGDDGVFYSDSMKVLWQGGKLVGMEEYEDGVLRPYMTLEYNSSNQVIKLQYYTESSVPGEYDSIRYANGKMSEIHYINRQGIRARYHKLTWTGENVTKDQVYVSNFDGTSNFPLVEEQTFSYIDKPGLSQLTKGNVLFWFSDMELSHLSANTVAATSFVDKVTGIEEWSAVYTYVFGANGLMESSKETVKEGDETTVNDAKFEYLDLK
jgi:hypothetical protein